MMNRRDFLNGCALSVAAGSAISPLEALAQGALSPYALPAVNEKTSRARARSYGSAQIKMLLALLMRADP